ncbi:hypothetical protein FNV43_RR00743 [Rhamnella rubrinervis]|uniref:Uncharacterized protein n=1 Tax=Rhamnella rubrinervis TaxID=2594499 RepID=A0A8K0HPQ6_9ROSA|nr:hypothetical protein FNV43_RR00743 [Rhamnella rubrinervis]
MDSRSRPDRQMARPSPNSPFNTERQIGSPILHCSPNFPEQTMPPASIRLAAALVPHHKLISIGTDNGKLLNGSPLLLDIGHLKAVFPLMSKFPEQQYNLGPRSGRSDRFKACFAFYIVNRLVEHDKYHAHPTNNSNLDAIDVIKNKPAWISLASWIEVFEIKTARLCGGFIHHLLLHQVESR